jgi:hypothetical protein
MTAEGQMDAEETELIYVMIPEGLGPLDRGEQFEDPLDDELQAGELGYVNGGGSQLGEEQPDGTRPIVFCGIDVEAYDLDKTLEVLRSRLPRLKCPPGTQLHYAREDEALQDEFDGSSWTLGQPRTMMHPGFGI